MAIGSLTAALLSARRRIPGCASCWSRSPASSSPPPLAALAPTYLLFALALVPVGLSALTALTTANAMVQLRVEP